MTATRPALPSAARVVRVVLAALVLTALGAVAAPPAGAHGGEGELEVLAVDAGRPGRVDVTVRLSYVDDGHHPEEATVTVAGTGPDGADLTPVTLSRGDGDGVFTGTVEVPVAGAWNLRVTAVEPPATVALPPVLVAGEGGDDTPASGDTAASDGDGATTTVGIDPVGSDEGGADATGSTASATPEVTAGAADEDDDGGIPWPAVGIGVAIGLAAVGLAFLNQRRRDARTGGGEAS
jgi:hypothetical protein